MKKKALRKDFYMEIRKSMGRFLSIFFIVAIGCAFFAGIRSSEPDMRYSGDAYFDRKNLMDLQVISTMGLTDEDVEAIEKLDGSKKRKQDIQWTHFVQRETIRSSCMSCRCFRP